MLHDRDDADDLAVDVLRRQLRGHGVCQFAAQVDQMLGPQHARLLSLLQRFDHRFEDLGALGIVGGCADTETVEDGGDAAADDLGIVGQGGAHEIPADMGAGIEVFFEMVGMDVDEAGQEIVAGKIQRIRMA